MQDALNQHIASLRKCRILVLLVVAVASCAPDRSTANKRPLEVELFDGVSLAGWRTLDFDGSGGQAVVDADGALRLDAGDPISGIVIDDPNFELPSGDYEIELEAKIIDGNDFFCGLTFPIPSQGTCCTLVVGGWGGTLVGISSVNGMDASQNTTRHDRPFESRRWYKIRVRVTGEYIDAWIDDEPVVELDIRKRKIGMRDGAIEQCQPIGLATYKTAAAYRHFVLRRL